MTNDYSKLWANSLEFDNTALAQLQSQFLENWKHIAQAATQGSLPEIKDRRFKSEAWQQSPAHLMMAHMYLLSGQAMKQMVDAALVPAQVKEKLNFSVNQWVDAMSPANFLATNPDAQKALIDSGGQSLQAGIQNFLNDLSKGRITQTDESKFEVGVNLAVSPGAVVFRNKYFELIQYQPQTGQVYQRPLLMVPPCINKYYILDLQPENSMIGYLVSQGFTVFVTSWRNPLPKDTDDIEKATWDDYIEDGVLRAIEQVREISGQPKINVLGFCVGGTMLSTALAVAAARRQNQVSSLTLLATMLDFSDTGMLGVFANEQHAKIRESQIGQGGLMTGRELSNTFSFLRPNELVWNYVVSNYLKGETPVPFDLLYWNSDSTNLPGPFFAWYFRNTYIENKLREPKALTVCGQSVDLGKIKVPAYIQASKEDHIVPWTTAYVSSRLLSGDVRFILAASGHIAGVINPVSKNRRSYWLNETSDNSVESGHWFESAQEHPGSWWADYADWLASHSGKKIVAPANLGAHSHPVIEPAPGSYVKVRAV